MFILTINSKFLRILSFIILIIIIAFFSSPYFYKSQNEIKREQQIQEMMIRLR